MKRRRSCPFSVSAVSLRSDFRPSVSSDLAYPVSMTPSDSRRSRWNDVLFECPQDPDTIMNSVAGQQIMQNMSTRLIGRIQPMAIESFVRLLHYERTIVARNASESFFPKRSELYSNWLLDIDGVSTYCRYYPSPMQIATVANNPDEQLARSRVLAKYPEHKLLGMAKFADRSARLYATALASMRSVKKPLIHPCKRIQRWPFMSSHKPSHPKLVTVTLSLAASGVIFTPHAANAEVLDDIASTLLQSQGGYSGAIISESGGSGGIDYSSATGSSSAGSSGRAVSAIKWGVGSATRLGARIGDPSGS